MPTLSDVLDLEEKLGHPLPLDYVGFLLRYNAVFISSALRVNPSPEYPYDNLCIDGFLGINTGNEHREVTSQLGLFDSRILPIATDPGAFLYAMALTDSDDFERGDIYLKTYDDWYYMAHGIEDFCSMIILP